RRGSGRAAAGARPRSSSPDRQRGLPPRRRRGPTWRAPRRGESASEQPAALARDAQRRLRERLQAGAGDRLPAALADAVGVVGDLLQRPVDVVDGGTRLGTEGEVALALDVDRAAFTRLLVELDVARLHLFGELVGFGPQCLGLTDVDLALPVQAVSLLIEQLLVVGRLDR